MAHGEHAPETWPELKQCFGESPVLLAGVNLWEHLWIEVPTKFAKVRGAPFGPIYDFQIYYVVVDGKRLFFAAGEFANNFWGFFVPPKSAAARCEL